MIYNIVFAIGVIIPILILIDAVGDVQTILLFFCLAEIGFATLAVLFVPKLLQYKASQIDNVSVASKSSSGTDSYSFIPLDNISTAPQLAAYISALQRHMDEARKAMHKYKITAVGSTTTLTPTGSGLSGSNLHSDPRLSISVGAAAGTGAADTVAVSGSPSIRISSRVQPQPGSDSAVNWRLSESRKMAWTPTRSSRSEAAGSSPHNDQQQNQQLEQEQAGAVPDGSASAHNRMQSAVTLQTPPQPQPHDCGRSSRALSVTAAGAASIIAVAAAKDEGVCADE